MKLLFLFILFIRQNNQILKLQSQRMCVYRVIFHCFIGLRDRVVFLPAVKECSHIRCVAALILNLALMGVSGQLLPLLLYLQHPLGGHQS